MKPLVTVFLSSLLLGGMPASAKTGQDFLREAQAPAFKEGHTLLPLTRWACPLSYELNVELAQRWGYALDINPGKVGEELDRPTSLASRLIAFNKSNDNRYPTFLATRRVMHEWDVINPLLSSHAWTRNSDGTLVLRSGQPVMKPYISDQDATAIAQAEIQRLTRLREQGVNVTIVLNGAEYMPGLLGHEKTYWEMDPEVKQWMSSLWTLPTQERIAAYASNKAKQEQAIRDAVLSVMPDSELVYYATGDIRRGLVSEEMRLAWAYPYRFMIKSGTIPSWEYYYGYNGYWVPSTSTTDYLLPHVTNGAAQAIEGGMPLSYNWLSAGWSLKDPSKVSDDKRYMGFLKYLYTLGSIGNVAGYFTFPPNGFNGDLGDTPPDWLRQIMLLSHAHATFTHLEDFLRQGDLLPGDGEHVYSRDLYGKPSWPHPAYEFVTNENSPAAKVAARKLSDEAEWLIVAWAAMGDDRDVSVTIPELGKVTVKARGSGSLYLVKPGPLLTLLDPAGMDPSRIVSAALAEARGGKPAPPTNIQVQ